MSVDTAQARQPIPGTFALVYVVGTAAAVRLLPGGWPRVAAVVSLIASCGLVVVIGPPALLPIGTGLCGMVWTSLRGPAGPKPDSAG